MKYYAPVQLACAAAIRAWAIGDIEQQLAGSKLTKPQHRVYHILPAELKQLINDELALHGCPGVYYAQSYCRQAGDTQGIHIDGVGDYQTVAINIPLKGCVGSKHVYYTGEYTTEQTQFEDIVFYKINWQSTPQVADILYLDSPHIVRVDHPHSAQATPFEDRWIFTMRFENSPTFEDLCTRLNATVN
jgi:hypothetical protein